MNCANASLTTACATETASGPSLRTVSSIIARLEHRPLDRQLLGRRPAPLADPGRVQRGEERDPAGDQQQRDEPEEPGGNADGPRGGAHHATSKMPCQPSSVNSDWWAWNMYWPGCGKRHSAIPRWPWQSITVSVSSDGVFDVPVG